jgi:hypothetical protein
LSQLRLLTVGQRTLVDVSTIDTIVYQPITPIRSMTPRSPNAAFVALNVASLICVVFSSSVAT